MSGPNTSANIQESNSDMDATVMEITNEENHNAPNYHALETWKVYLDTIPDLKNAEKVLETFVKHIGLSLGTLLTLNDSHLLAFIGDVFAPSEYNTFKLVNFNIYKYHFVEWFHV
jgi:hypothetical protein